MNLVIRCRLHEHWGGVIVGALSFRKEYDGHTVEKSLEQTERITGKRPTKLAGDRGYRGRKWYRSTELVIPSSPSPKESRYQREKKRVLFRKRAAIEPIIGHLKSDHRLNRNFYKGLFGDAINVMLAAAAFNFKRAMAFLWVYIMATSDKTSDLKNILKSDVLVFKDWLINHFLCNRHCHASNYLRV